MDSTASTAFVRIFFALNLTLLTGAVLANPTVTTHPTSQSVSEGNGVSFTVVATGAPTPAYQWQRDNTNLPGATAATLAIPAAYASDNSAVYRAIVTNSGGSDTSDPATLTVTARVPSADSNLANWPHSRTIHLNTKASGAGISGDVHGFPLAVRLHSGNFSFPQARKDGQDLRFSKSNGVRLPHEIEYWDAVACSAVVWVGLDTVKANDSTQHIRMFWGKEDAEKDNNWTAIFDTTAGFGGVWHLNEKPNDFPRIMRDRSAFGRFGTGTNFSSSGWVTAVLGKGTKFDGTNDHISLGTDIPALSTVPAATFSSWVYLPHTNSKKILFGLSKNNGSATNDSRFAVYLQNQKIHVEARAGDGEALQTSSTVDTVAANTWLHLAAVVDYANDSILVYINGAAKALNQLPTFSSTQTSATVSSNGAFGSEDLGASTYLDGRLDEIQLSRVKRNADWVKLAYENERPGASILSFGQSYQAWSNNRDIFLNTTSAGADIDQNQFDFPVLVRLDSTHLSFNQVRGNAEDLRFSNANGRPLSVSIQSWDSAGGTGLIWVKADTILGNNSQQYIRMHWGQPQTTAGARTDAVFDTSLGYGGAWHLDENPGGGSDAFKDLTILANHGTTGGSMSLSDRITGMVGPGTRFDGGDDYLNIGDSLSVVSKVEGATISGWIRMDSLPVMERTVVAFSINSSSANKTPRAGLFIENKKLRVTGRSEDLVDVSTVTTLDSLSEDEWYHVSGLIDYQNDSIRIYVNGEPWTTTGAVCFEDSATNSSYSRSNKFAAYGDLAGGYMPGALDEVHISRVARSREWLQLTYENQRPGSTFLEWETNAVVTITSPAAGYTTNQETIAITWTVNGEIQGTQTTEDLGEDGEHEVVRCFLGVCDEISVFRDTQAPVVTISELNSGDTICTSTVQVYHSVDEVQQSPFSESIKFGLDTIRVYVSDDAGNIGSDSVIVFRRGTPLVEITFPPDSTYSRDPYTAVSWKVDGVDQSATFIYFSNFGWNPIVLTSTNSCGIMGRDTVWIHFDPTPPVITLISPLQGDIVLEDSILILWAADDVIQTPISHLMDTSGANYIHLRKTDLTGNKDSLTLTLYPGIRAPGILGLTKVQADSVVAAHVLLPMGTWIDNDTIPTGEVFTQLPVEDDSIQYHHPVRFAVSRGPDAQDLIPVRFDADSVTVDPITLVAGGHTQLVLTNSGRGTVVDSFVILVFEDRNLDRQFDEGDLDLGRTSHNSTLVAGDTLVLDISVAGVLTFNGNRLTVMVDYGNQIAEVDEANNVSHTMANCLKVPDSIDYSPQLKWRWHDSTLSNRGRVYSSPVVGQMNDDNFDGEIDAEDIPDIIVSITDGYNNNDIMVLDGRTGSELWRANCKLLVQSRPAVGDLEGDGSPEIVLIEEHPSLSKLKRILVLNDTGGVQATGEWRDFGNISFGIVEAVNLHDLDGDGKSEILWGINIHSSDGRLLYPKRFYHKYAKAVPVDLDRDGYQELITHMPPPNEFNDRILMVNFKGKKVIKVASTGIPQTARDLMVVRNSSSTEPEIVFHHMGYPQDSVGEVFAVNMDLNSVSKIPSVSFEVPGYANASEEYNSGESFYFGTNSVRLQYVVGTAWVDDSLVPFFSRTNMKDSSIAYHVFPRAGHTFARGTIFDLNDDGNPEVLLQSKDTLYVVDPDGNVRSTTPFYGHGYTSNITVADIDRDNHADLILTGGAGYDTATVAVYTNSTWVGARSIFTNRDYTETNINDDGTIPRFPAPSWEANNTAGIQCAQGKYACMDISASFPQVTVVGSDTMVRARIGNGGAVELPAGLRISFYLAHGAGSDSLLGTLTLESRLAPGAYVTLQREIPGELRGLYYFRIAADDSGDGQGYFDESSEGNNSVTLSMMIRNGIPTVSTPSNQFAIPGTEFTYQVEAEDPDADGLTYNLLKSPSGMFINGSGVIHWTPVEPPPRCTVTVEVSDPYDGVASTTFLVYVDDGTNLPPVLNFIPDTTAILNTFSSSPFFSHRDTMAAIDPENEEPLEFDLACLNCGTKPNPELIGHEIVWIPVQPFWTVADSGRFRLRVTDARGAVSTKEWTVRLNRIANTAPVFGHTPDTTAVEDIPWKSPVSVIDLDQDVISILLDTIPLGMSFSNDSLRWTPSVSGAYVVRIGADDGYDTSWQRFDVVVSPVNDAPEIVSAAITQTIPGALYQYHVRANDEDGDAVAFSLAQAPSGMTISPEGLISWTPLPSQSTSVNVEVVAQDPSEAEDRQSWSLNMVPDTIAPIVHLGFSKNPALVGTSVTVTFSVGDNVGIEDSTLTRDGTPVTMTSGQYVFTPSSTGTIVFLGQAVDPSSNVGTFSATLRVTNAADLTPPEVEIAYSPEDPEAAEIITFTVTVTDTDGVDASRQWVEVDGAYIPVVSGQAQYVARRPGPLTAKAIAFDSLGASNLDEVSFFVSPLGGDGTPPSASISSPAEDSVVYGVIPIEGTASDSNLAYYTLSYRDLNTSAWVEYHRSTTSITADSLGVIDATSLTNGDYKIRLDVYDRAGNSNSDTVQVQVAGEKKIGNFTLAFQDLTLPMSGLELTVTRSYDSRVKTQGDFGIGWKMGMRSISLHENRNQGTDWEIQRTPGLIPNYYFAEGKPHSVTVTLPGGRKQEFVPEPEFFSPLSPTYGVMQYRANPGTYSRLEAVEVDTFVVMGGELYDERGDFEEPFNPQVYRITLLDGSYFVYDQTAGGVIEAGDANGNVTNWENNAIRHNAGEKIDFTRDAFNRISSISDGAGRGMQYRYDVVGNLSEVLDANGNSTRFNYGPRSYLLEVIDARGVRAARTEYDDDGRMILQVNALGDTLHLIHDLAANTEEIVDFNGRVTTYTYDEQGNVLIKTDDAENTWSYAYDSVGNVLSTTQPGGGIQSSTYDDQGNELTSTDELEYTTYREYDDGGRVLSSEDPLGRITVFEYDSRGNLEREIGPGNVVQSERTYDSRGNLLSEENALGFITTHAYDTRGWLTSTTDPLGRVTTFAYDPAGNVIREVNPEGDTTRYGYDANGNRTLAVNAFGDTTKTEYNVIYKPVRQIDARGHSTWFVYNALGDKVLDIAADSSVTEREYDAGGNVSAIIDPVGRRVEMTYDHDNRLERTTYTEAQYNENSYDALGRRIASRDANGNVTEYGYDLAGRDTVVIDATGNRTRFEYDAVGRKTAMVDAIGFRTDYAYDAYDRLITTTFADGTTKVIGYDLGGRKTSEIDQMGRTTLFEYDSVGNLTAVVDAMNQRTEYTYDANNNRLSQEDANNHATSIAYDALGRMTRRTYPNGNQERWGYDPNGNALYHVKGGDSTAYAFDAMNREVFRKHFPSGHEVTSRYASDGKRDTVIDYRGTSTYAYDSRGRLFKETMANGDFIESHYDPQGNRTHLITPFGETQYGYDALNRMDSVTSPQNQVTVYRYNAVGNRDSVLYPNGISTGYSYDSLHRLVEVRNWSPADTLLSLFSYTLDSAGIRRAVVELDSSVVNYTYDPLYRLTGETRIGTHPYVRTYAYDNVGNRLIQVVDGDTTTYDYNNRDQLEEEVGPGGTTEYDYDAAGRLISKATGSGTTTYLWVDNDRLDSISGPGVALSYTYDADGRKVKETTPDTVRQFLVDRLLPYGQVILETDGAGDLVTEYVYGQERISKERGGVSNWYLADGQGSVRQLVDSAGDITDAYAYTAFGDSLATTGSSVNEFRYVGEQADPNSGFYYLRARWMDPSVGRFASVDPFEGCVSCPQSLHDYSYANLSPISMNDPSGEITNLSDAMSALVSQSILRGRNLVIGTTIRGQGKKVITHLLCAGAQVAARDAEIHHIFTDKNKTYTPKGLDAIGAKNKKVLQGWFNLLKLPGHRGRHSNEYHEAVLSALEAAVTGKGEAEAAEAAVRVLVDIASDLCEKKGPFWKALSNVP